MEEDNLIDKNNFTSILDVSTTATQLHNLQVPSRTAETLECTLRCDSHSPPSVAPKGSKSPQQAVTPPSKQHKSGHISTMLSQPFTMFQVGGSKGQSEIPKNMVL
jgi:hypothetical protein